MISSKSQRQAPNGIQIQRNLSHAHLALATFVQVNII